MRFTFQHGNGLRFAHFLLFMFISLLLVSRFFRSLFNLSNQLCLGGLSCFHESFHVCVFPRVCFAACAATVWTERELLNFSEHGMQLGQLFILRIDAHLQREKIFGQWCWVQHLLFCRRHLPGPDNTDTNLMKFMISDPVLPTLHTFSLIRPTLFDFNPLVRIGHTPATISAVALLHSSTQSSIFFTVPRAPAHLHVFFSNEPLLFPVPLFL